MIENNLAMQLRDLKLTLVVNKSGNDIPYTPESKNWIVVKPTDSFSDVQNIINIYAASLAPKEMSFLEQACKDFNIPVIEF